jgi:hypothetical protein
VDYILSEDFPPLLMFTAKKMFKIIRGFWSDSRVIDECLIQYGVSGRSYPLTQGKRFTSETASLGRAKEINHTGKAKVCVSLVA